MKTRSIGDSALGQRRLHVGVGAQHLVTLEEFVDGEVGLHAGMCSNDSTRSSVRDTTPL